MNTQQIKPAIYSATILRTKNTALLCGLLHVQTLKDYLQEWRICIFQNYNPFYYNIKVTVL
jgi:hypothetical protein